MSNPIESENKIKIYERDGNNISLVSDSQPLIVRNHWNEGSKIVLYLNGNEITVVADDLKKAIQNAQNAHSF